MRFLYLSVPIKREKRIMSCLGLELVVVSIGAFFDGFWGTFEF